jgi:hypothetical protein
MINMIENLESKIYSVEEEMREEEDIFNLSLDTHRKLIHQELLYSKNPEEKQELSKYLMDLANFQRSQKNTLDNLDGPGSYKSYASNLEKESLDFYNYWDQYLKLLKNEGSVSGGAENRIREGLEYIRDHAIEVGDFTPAMIETSYMSDGEKKESLFGRIGSGLGESGLVKNLKKIVIPIFAGAAIAASAVAILHKGEEHPYDFSKTRETVFRPYHENFDYTHYIPSISDKNFDQRILDDHLTGPYAVPEELIQITDGQIKNTENSVLAVAEMVQEEVQKYLKSQGIISCLPHAMYISLLDKKHFGELGLNARVCKANALSSENKHAEVLIFHDDQLNVSYSLWKGIDNYEKSWYKTRLDYPPENKTIFVEYPEMLERVGPERAKLYLLAGLLDSFDSQFYQKFYPDENKLYSKWYPDWVTLANGTAEDLATRFISEGPDRNAAKQIQQCIDYINSPQHLKDKFIFIGKGRNITCLRTTDNGLFYDVQNNKGPEELGKLLEDMYL